MPQTQNKKGSLIIEEKMKKQVNIIMRMILKIIKNEGFIKNCIEKGFRNSLQQQIVIFNCMEYKLNNLISTMKIQAIFILALIAIASAQYSDDQSSSDSGNSIQCEAGFYLDQQDGNCYPRSQTCKTFVNNVTNQCESCWNSQQIVDSVTKLCVYDYDPCASRDDDGKCLVCWWGNPVEGVCQRK